METKRPNLSAPVTLLDAATLATISAGHNPIAAATRVSGDPATLIGLELPIAPVGDVRSQTPLGPSILKGTDTSH